ncbi:MAG TPA: hypothetical protein VF756_08890 [Thermoanaerobaculia bacterium]
MSSTPSSRQALLWVVLVLALASAKVEAQNPDLMFHTVSPCTVVDTRVAGGAFAAHETRTYNVVGSGSFASQGGSATGCGVPGFSNGIAQVQAVALVFTAFTPAGQGYIASNAADQAIGVGAVVTFQPGDLSTNTSQVAVAQTSGVGDFKVLVAFSTSHVVIRAVGYYSKPVQTVHVHPVPGDATASGTDLLNALAGVTNASATKRYVLKIEPGIYDIGTTMLVMKPYVDIEGSGQQATVIQGLGNNDAAFGTGIIKGAASSELRSLQVKSTGSVSLPFSIGIIVMNGADTRIKDVTIVSSGPITNWGVRALQAKPTIEDVTIDVQGGDTSYGVSSVAEGADPIIERTKIRVTNATNGHGIFAIDFANLSSLRDLQINISGGSTGYGIRVLSSSGFGTTKLTNSAISVQSTNSYGVDYSAVAQLRIEQSQVRANGSGSYGLWGSGSFGTAIVNHSEITGATSTVSGFITALIGASQLSGGAASAGTTCAGVYDESYTFFAGPACP